MSDFLAGGTIVQVSTSAPSTFDAAGYGAVGGLSTIGEIDEIQGDIGRLYNLLTRYPLAGAGRPRKRKGNYNDGNISLPIAVDYSDAGQNAIRTAVASMTEVTLKIILPTSTIIYCQGLVLGAPVNLGGTESFVMTNVSIEIVTSSTGVGIVVV
ncbi:hypothetical protein [Rhizorhabdus sp.]|uniref:hypothetical protein n=1 Tax=Rhizorhabdus sp. TaxID=1968843 RepID=UPI0019C84CC4|nr:hypothetical protein [Rhizorhabdus sp.]MBD3762467.1 hypothetical protein [Rhizorhabdus sp.]